MEPTAIETGDLVEDTLPRCKRGPAPAKSPAGDPAGLCKKQDSALTPPLSLSSARLRSCRRTGRSWEGSRCACGGSGHGARGYRWLPAARIGCDRLRLRAMGSTPSSVVNTRVMAVARITLRSQLSLMQSLLMGTLSVWPSISTSIFGLSFTTVATLASTAFALGPIVVLPLLKSILSLSEMKTTLFSTLITTSVSFKLPSELFRLMTKRQRHGVLSWSGHPACCGSASLSP
jgi:hypothetical protein